MELGPTSIRPHIGLESMVKRMRKAGVTSILVTSSSGELLGAVQSSHPSLPNANRIRFERGREELPGASCQLPVAVARWWWREPFLGLQTPLEGVHSPRKADQGGPATLGWEPPGRGRREGNRPRSCTDRLARQGRSFAFFEVLA
jgi:hypothetical protein